MLNYANMPKTSLDRFEPSQASPLEGVKATYYPHVLNLIMKQMGQGRGGPVGHQPTITPGAVWTPEQVQGQVNAARSGIDASTATQQRQAAQSTAGRGFGGSSPLLQALQSQIAGRGMASSADAERGIRWDAATGNAKHLLASQQAAEQQYANRQKEAIDRGSQMSYLLQALSSMI